MKSEPKAFASLSSGLLARKGAARPAMRPQGFGQGGNGLDDLGWNDMGYEAPRPTLTPIEGGEAARDAGPQVSRTPLAGLTPISPVHHQHAEIEERFNSSEEEEDEAFESDAPACEAPISAWQAEPENDDTLELADELPEAMPQVSAEVEPVFAAAMVPMPRPLPEAEEQIAPAPAPAAKRSRAPRATASAKEKAAFTLRLDPNRHLKLRLACAVNAKSAQQLVTSALDKLLESMPELDAMASRAPDQGSRKG